MDNAASPTSTVVALALAGLLLTPAIAAQSYGSSEARPAETYDRLTRALEEGNAEQASSAYRDGFSSAASTNPAVQAVVEDNLAQVRNATPGDATYDAARETVAKGLLAVAFHATQDASLSGDADRAREWFQVLADGFDEAPGIADLEPRFANATDEDVDELADPLGETVRDLTARETYHEVSEVPGLVAGGEVHEAAKEAGEAAGYALGIRADVEQRLGAQAADKLDAELSELVELARAGDAEGAEHEAQEILELLAEYGLASAPQEKVEAFERYEEALEDDEFDQARDTYEEAFQGEALEYAPQADQRIQEAFTAAQEAETDGDRAEAIETLEKTILDVAWKVGFHELAEGEVHEGLEWLAPLPATFGWYEDRPDAAAPLGHIAASGDASQKHTGALQANLGEALADKVREEVEEVFINWNDTATARAKAAEAVLYARPAQAFFETELGASPTTELFDELDVLRNQTRAGDRDAAREAGDEVVKLLDKLRAGEGASDLEQLLVEIEDKTDFVAEEYVGYVEAREAGDEDEARTELGEAHAFTNATLGLVQANRDLLESTDADAYAEIVDRLETIQTRLLEKAPVGEVTDEVNATLDLLDAFRTAQGPSVDVRVGEPTPADGGAYWIPIQLVGVPEGGFAVQATITYDAATLDVQDVEVPPQVGAKQLGDGEVSFNAASTGDTGSQPTVARLKVAWTGEATEQSVSLTVDELTDAEGEPLAVGNVTGTSLNAESFQEAADGAEGNVTGAQAPGPALAWILAGLAATALVLGRRKA